MGVDSVSIEVSLLLAELSHRADRWGNLNREIHTNTQITNKQINWGKNTIELALQDVCLNTANS